MQKENTLNIHLHSTKDEDVKKHHWHQAPPSLHFLFPFRLIFTTLQLQRYTRPPQSHTLSLIPLLSTAHLQQLPTVITGHSVICKHCSSQRQHSYNRRLFGLLMYHYWNTVTTVRHETAVQSDISTQSQFTSFTYRKERFNPFIN